MKKLLIGAALAAASLSASAQVSISVGQPGFFGRVELGAYAPPPVVYGPPVLVSGGYVGDPIYLRVPLEHRRHWARYCGRYHACGQRVLFVRDDWYLNSYAPRYREYYGRGGPGWHGGGPGWHGGGRPDFHDNRGHGGFDHGRGPDRGPGRGPDRGPGGPGPGGGDHHGGGEHGGGGHQGGGGHGGGEHGR